MKKKDIKIGEQYACGTGKRKVIMSCVGYAHVPGSRRYRQSNWAVVAQQVSDVPSPAFVFKDNVGALVVFQPQHVMPVSEFDAAQDKKEAEKAADWRRCEARNVALSNLNLGGTVIPYGTYSGRVQYPSADALLALAELVRAGGEVMNVVFTLPPETRHEIAAAGENR